MPEIPEPEPPIPGAVLITSYYSNRWQTNHYDGRYYVQIDHGDTQVIDGKLMQLYRVWRLSKEDNHT